MFPPSSRSWASAKGKKGWPFRGKIINKVGLLFHRKVVSVVCCQYNIKYAESHIRLVSLRGCSANQLKELGSLPFECLVSGNDIQRGRYKILLDDGSFVFALIGPFGFTEPFVYT